MRFLQEIFKKMDWDRNGTISRTEFKSYLQEMKKGEEINMEEVLTAFKNMDKNKDNQISWDEFYVSPYLKCCCTERRSSFVFVRLFEDIAHWMH